MSRLIILLLFILFFQFCSRHSGQNRKENDTDAVSEISKVSKSENEFRYFYPSGKLKAVYKIKNEKADGIFHEYYENGQLSESGIFRNNKPTGWVKYYTPTGQVHSLREYILVDTFSYMNQVIVYDQEGKINKEKSNYFSIFTKSDSVKLGDILKMELKLDAPYFEESTLEIVLGDFDEYFTPKLGGKLYNSVTPDKTKTFTKKTEKIGKEFIRGLIIENSKTFSDSLNGFPTRTLYFCKTFIVY